MLKSEWSESKLKFWTQRGVMPALCLLAALLTLPTASAQTDFSLTATPLNPDAVAPGGESFSNISVVTASGFTGTVALSCTVTTPVMNTVSLPVCKVSPASLTASGGATATITTTATTTTVSYSITITGTDASGTVSTQPMTLTVLAVIPQFTITVTSAVAPSSVVAGTGASGMISVNPLNNYSTPKGGFITLSCSSITPLVTIAPICSFSYPPGQSGIVVGSNTPQSSTLTITTSGPTPTGAVASPKTWYALWLPVPMLALAGVGAAVSGRQSRKWFGLSAVFVAISFLFLVPGCGNNAASTTAPNGVTPANTYTFTIVGVDTNGVASSNTGSTTSTGPTVTLTVTAPPKP